MIHEDFSSPIDLIYNSIGMEFFCNGIKHQITVETSGLSARNAWVIQGGPGACSLRKMFENWTLGNAKSCIHWIEDN